MRFSSPVLPLTLYVLFLSMLGACSPSPTGRSQVILFSDSEMSQLGSQSFKELKKKETISTNKIQIAYVNCIANAIIKQVPKQSIQLWRNMAQASGDNQPPELLSTHPSHNTRINGLTAEISRLPNYKTQAPHRLLTSPGQPHE